MNRFYKNGRLKDTEIALALSQAATDYENGLLMEVDDVLLEIHAAITDFCNDYDYTGERK